MSMNALSLYARYVSISLRSQLEYRASFIMQAFGQFLITGGDHVYEGFAASPPVCSEAHGVAGES